MAEHRGSSDTGGGSILSLALGFVAPRYRPHVRAIALTLAILFAIGSVGVGGWVARDKLGIHVESTSRAEPLLADIGPKIEANHQLAEFNSKRLDDHDQQLIVIQRALGKLDLINDNLKRLEDKEERWHEDQERR